MSGNHNSGRKPQTKTRAQLQLRLQALGPGAIHLIEELGAERSLDQGQQRALDNAWRIFEQICGKAPQSIKIGGDEDSGPVRVRLEPASYEQEQLP